MVVVSDASPVNILVRLGQIELLPAFFGRIVIPTSVAQEMSRAGTPAAVKHWIEHAPAWFAVQTPSASGTPIRLRHQGERDAIALAIQIQAAAILVDEQRARTEARSLGLLVVGTVGILERAADQGIIPDLRAVHSLLRNTDFRVRDRILDDSLARHLRRKTQS